MTGIVSLVLTALLCQTPGPAPSPGPPAAVAPASPVAPPSPSPEPPDEPEPSSEPSSEQPLPAAVAPEPPPLAPRRYGDRGTSDLSLGLGYSSSAGFLASAGFRYFVVDGLAPGLEAHYLSGGTTAPAFGLVLANLRAVPVRTDGLALVMTGRAGRALLAHHGDGWAIGGSGGVVVFLASRVGLEIGYEVLRLLPASFCADLDRCVIHGPVIGLRIVF
jgi:hypothetical protein